MKREQIDQGNLILSTADARDLSHLETESYDCVVLIAWLKDDNWPHSGTVALSEALRVLKSGGKFFANSFESDNLCDALEDLGLSRRELRRSLGTVTLVKQASAPLIDLRKVPPPPPLPQ